MINNTKDTSMAKRLMNMMIIATASMWALAGCDNSAETAAQASEPVVATADSSTTATKTIDWAVMASGEKPLTLPIINIRLRLIAKMSVIMQNISKWIMPPLSII